MITILSVHNKLLSLACCIMLTFEKKNRKKNLPKENCQMEIRNGNVTFMQNISIERKKTENHRPIKETNFKKLRQCCRFVVLSYVTMTFFTHNCENRFNVIHMDWRTHIHASVKFEIAWSRPNQYMGIANDIEIRCRNRGCQWMGGGSSCCVWHSFRPVQHLSVHTRRLVKMLKLVFNERYLFGVMGALK